MDSWDLFSDEIVQIAEYFQAFDVLKNDNLISLAEFN